MWLKNFNENNFVKFLLVLNKQQLSVTTESVSAFRKVGHFPSGSALAYC